MDELHAFEAWAGALLAKLEPAARRRVTLAIARDLRSSQQARIAAQRNPDGSAFAPRKRALKKAGKLRGKAGRIRRQAMFVKLRTARFMKMESDAAGLAIGFSGRVARLARVHQLGESAPIVPNGPSYQYPVREVLGLNQIDRELIRDRLLAYLSD